MPCVGQLTIAESLHQHAVRVYSPAATPTSAGRANTHHWRVDFDVLQNSHRWENPLIGWASTYVYIMHSD